MALPSLALAQSPGDVETVRVPAGERTFLFEGASYDPATCTTSSTGYRLEITDPPDNGRIIETDGAIRNFDTGTACGVIPEIPTTAYFYEPDSGFQGEDRASGRFAAIPAGTLTIERVQNEAPEVFDDLDTDIGTLIIIVGEGTPEDVNTAAVAQEETLRTTVRNVTSLISRRVSQFARPSRAPGAAPGAAPQASAGALIGGDIAEAISLDHDSVELAILNGATGIAGGDGERRLGIWLNGAYTFLDGDDGGVADFDGDVITIIGGLDYQITPQVLAGVSLSGEFTEIDTGFNNGDSETTGFNIVPYAAVTLLDGRVVLDGYAGYGANNTDTSRRPEGQGTITGTYDSTRWLVGANATYYHVVDAWTLSATGGYSYATEDSDAFIESDGTEVASRDTDLGTVRLEGRAAYFFGMAEPYVRAAYLLDVNDGDDDRLADVDLDDDLGVRNDSDDDAVEAAIGLNLFLSDRATAGFEVFHEFLREDVDTTTINANVRIVF